VLLAGGLGAVGIAIAVITVVMLPARSGPHGVTKALVTIEQRYAQQPPAAGERASDPFGALPGWLRGVALRLSPSGIVGSLQRRLDLAGNPARWTPDRILAVKGLGLLVLAALGALYGLHDAGLLILCAIVGGAIGFFLPDVLLYNARLKWQARLRAAMPDALDMLTVCVEAGLGFDASLAQVARNTKGPLAAEFARVLQEMQIGKSRADALRDLGDRTTIPELKSFVLAMIQADIFGISIAKVLHVQANEMRVKRRQRAEEKAQKVPVKIVFPLLTCIFPSLFVILLGPAMISIYNAFTHHK